MSRGKPAHENIRRPEKVDSLELNSVTAKLLSKFTCKQPTFRSVFLYPLALPYFFKYQNIKSRQSLLKNQLPNENFATFYGILWISRTISKFLFTYLLHDFSQKPGWETLLDSFTHYVPHKFAQFATHVMMAKRILPGYFLTVKVEPVNREFHDDRR